MAYGVWRFFIELVRDDPERGALAGFSTSQLISLALIPIAAFAYYTLHRRAKELGFPAVPTLGRSVPSATAGPGSNAPSTRKR